MNQKHHLWTPLAWALLFCSVCSKTSAHPLCTKSPCVQVAQLELPARQWQKSSSPFVGQHANTKIIWARMRSLFQFNVPEHHPRVQKYIQYYTRSNVIFNQMLQKGTPYFYFILDEVEKRGFPGELALLPLIESGFDPFANSPSGATGLWQIMPATGKSLGLKYDHWYHGARDLHDSTQAALDFLGYLSLKFNDDWLHSIAAYNLGEGRVRRAIKQQKKAKQNTDFWHLALPKETRDYIPKLLAIAKIIENPTRYGIKLKPINNQPYLSRVELNKPIQMSRAAKLASLSIKKLKQYNPGYQKEMTHPHGPFHLFLPVAKVDSFRVKYYRLMAQKPPEYIVKPGDSLSKLAKQFNTTVLQLKTLNQLSHNIIKIGQPLKLPHIHLPVDPDKVHVVRKGDSLWSISRQYRLNMKDIQTINGLTLNAFLMPGQKIRLPMF